MDRARSDTQGLSRYFHRPEADSQGEGYRGSLGKLVKTVGLRPKNTISCRAVGLFWAFSLGKTVGNIGES